MAKVPACKTEAYSEQYLQEQAMVTLRDAIRSLKNNGGEDWWAELAYDKHGCYLLVILKNGRVYATTSIEDRSNQ